MRILKVAYPPIKIFLRQSFFRTWGGLGGGGTFEVNLGVRILGSLFARKTEEIPRPFGWTWPGPTYPAPPPRLPTFTKNKKKKPFCLTWPVRRHLLDGIRKLNVTRTHGGFLNERTCLKGGWTVQQVCDVHHLVHPSTCRQAPAGTIRAEVSLSVLL